MAVVERKTKAGRTVTVQQYTRPGKHIGKERTERGRDQPSSEGGEHTEGGDEADLANER